jgi:hypothetical protein
MNTKEKELIESIKGLMKIHGLTSYRVGIFDSRIGKIRVTPKGWERLLVPIKGYHHDIFDLYKIIQLSGELYFIVEEEHQTYDYPRKREKYRFTWDGLVNLVKTTKWSKRNWGFGGNDHTDWETNKLKSIESSLKYYDAQEEAKWRKQPRLTDANIDVLVKVQESETSFAEKLVDKLFGY